MALHLAILAAGARGHRKRHANSRAQRRLRPVRPNFRAELRYRAGLLQLVARCRELADGALKSIEAHWPRPTAGDAIQVIDAIPASLAEEIKRAAAKLGNLDAWAKRLVGISVEANRDSVYTRLARVIREAIGVDVTRLLEGDHRLRATMRAATDANIALIKSIPPTYFDRVLETVSSGWTQGMRWESLVEQIQHDGDVTENRAKVIARDQTAKMNSAFNRERQQQVGIEKYEWQTSGDERVRGNPAGKYPDAESDHWDLDGKVFRWDEPGPCKGTISGEPCHPGEDIEDRCVAIPYVDMESLELDLGMAEQEQEQAA
jgi:SPP1 gp7 family putative phage head morphogenesis protein